MDFTNKVVLITGASSGIGAAAAVLFAERSAKVVLVGRNVTKLKEVSQKCEKAKGVKPLWIAADVTKEEDVKRIVDETLKHFGKLDVLVNNAGAAQPDGLLNPNLKVFDDTFNLNVRSVYHLTSLFTPALIESKGNIINVSSIASSSASVFATSYSMSKAALDHFTKVSALELAPKGIRVNVVNPGLTITNFQQTMMKDANKVKELVSNYSSKIPLGKACEADEVGDIIVYLASDKAKSITGSKFVVDGGLLLTS